MAAGLNGMKDSHAHGTMRRLRCAAFARHPSNRSIAPIRRRAAANGSMHGSRAGFTLVEVIVAIAILAVALTALSNAIGTGLRQTGQAEKMAEAGSLAQALLARLGPEIPIGERQEAGQLPNGFRWRSSSREFGDADDRMQWPISAFTVSVEVLWDDGVRERSFVLTTLRLAPKESAR